VRALPHRAGTDGLRVVDAGIVNFASLSMASNRPCPGSGSEIVPARRARGNERPLRARPTVADFRDLGSETPEGRLFLVTLDVRLPAGNPYRTSVSSAVPADVGYKLQPGTEVAIRVLMSAKDDVKVDWRNP
jgi:hypothetical protein